MAVEISKAKAWREWKLYGFILLPLVLVLVFSYYPIVSAVYHSFFEWQGGEAKTFVGWKQYQKAWGDSTLWRSFITVSILIAANLFKMLPSLLMAVLVHRVKSERWKYVYRVLLVVPMIIPGLVTLFIWKFFFDPQGVLNRMLDVFGIKTLLVKMDLLFGWGIFFSDVPIGWLSTPGLIVPSLILWGAPWIGAVGVLIYLSGLQSIGTEVYEAAELDGVSSFQKFWHIELPLLMTQVRISLILMVIGTVQGYGFQYLILGENGGAGGRGMVPGLWMFNRAFFAGEFGYACAIGMILFTFMLGLTYLQNKYVRIEK